MYINGLVQKVVGGQIDRFQSGIVHIRHQPLLSPFLSAYFLSFS